MNHPQAARRAVAQVGFFASVRLARDGDAAAIGENDCENVDGDSLPVGAGFRARNLISPAAIVARTGFQRDDRRAEHRRAERRHEVADESGEIGGEGAVEERAARKVEGRAVGEADRGETDRIGDAAVGQGSRRRGDGLRRHPLRLEVREARAAVARRRFRRPGRGGRRPLRLRRG